MTYCETCDLPTCTQCPLLGDGEGTMVNYKCPICEKNFIEREEECCGECGFDQYHQDQWEQIGYPTQEEWEETK